MGARIESTIANIKNATNCGKPGVFNCHVLPNTFAKNYYAPERYIFSQPADGSGPWLQISIDKVVSRQNFYSITHSDGTDSLSLERLFKTIEDHVPDWLKAKGVNAHTRGEPEYWMAWFLAAQAQRTPYAAKIRLEHNKNTPADMPIGALIAANLTEAKTLAKKIFSWHWRVISLNQYQTKEEMFLGETTGFRYGDGLIHNVRRHTVLECSPTIATACDVVKHSSEEEELKMIAGMNHATIQANAAHDGYIYRASTP